MMDGVLDLIFTFIFCHLTKVDYWVGFSSQSWLGPLLLGRLDELYHSRLSQFAFFNRS